MLTDDIFVTININKIFKNYQDNDKDIYLWGGVRTINKFCHLADKIILIRTFTNRKQGLKFKETILKNFYLMKIERKEKLQVELFNKKL